MIETSAYLKVEFPFGLKLKFAPDEVMFVRAAVNLKVLNADNEAKPLNVNDDLVIPYWGPSQLSWKLYPSTKAVDMVGAKEL